MAAPIFQFKRGLLTNLPGLQAGEPAFTTDTHDLFVGLSSDTATNKFFGSHRYWIKETTSTASGLNLVEGTSNGSDYITIKSPDSLAGIVTYTLPGIQGSSSSVLTNDGSGNLTWSSGSADPVFTGIATFTDTTDNTLGDSDTGAVQIDGGLGIDKNVTVGANLNVQGYSEFVGVSTFTGAIDANGGADISGGETTLSSATVSDLTSGRVVLAGTSGSLEDSGNLTFNGSTLNVIGLADLDDVNVSSAATITTADIGTATIDSLTFTSGTAITSVDTDLSSVSGSDDTLASAKAIKAYVDAQVTAQDFDFSGDTGTGAVDLDSQTFTIAGTASEIVTSASGQTITIGLPDNVIVGAALTVTGALDVNSGADISGGETTLSSATVSDLTAGRVVLAGTSGALEDSTNLTFGGGGLIVGAGGINITGVSTFSTNVTVGGDLTVGGNDIKASDGTTALTLADSTGAVTTANDLTVTGNLYVSGNTTQVNTAALTVEDRTIDLGIVNGATPSSATTWDLGVLFNYHASGSAKKSAVIWEHGDTRFKFASVLSADTNGSDNDTPQLSVTTFAPIEIGGLWVTDCAGTSQVISCTGTERFLENITVDAGTF